MTQTILQIDSSIFGNNGNSSVLSNYVVAQLTANSESKPKVTQRNVSVDEIPHLSAQTIKAISQGEATLADTLIEEIQAADTIIIGAPMYNFGLPTQLKSWFDHIARAGVTFRYTENGPQGLLAGKKAIVLHTYGGKHAGTGRDTAVSYLDTMFAFVGITEVKHIVAEGLAMSDFKDTAIDAAKTDIDQYISINTTQGATV